MLIVSTKQRCAKEDKADVARRALAGEPILLWSGEHYQTPATWVEGKACLRIKVGKHRKIVKGRLEFDSDGRDNYSFTFYPHRARVSKL